MSFFLPWQLELAEIYLKNKDKIHTSIVHGSNGIGKFEFAFSYAASLLCESEHNTIACGGCTSCNLIEKNNHPDLKLIYPESMNMNKSEMSLEGEGFRYIDIIENNNYSREIRVQQIRDLLPWLNVTSHRGKKKIIIIYSANCLNEISSNALLKILEEPPLGVVFLIVTNNLHKLLPTIISRCQLIHLPIPKKNISLDWLRNVTKLDLLDIEKWLTFTGGAPLKSFFIIKNNLSEPCPFWIMGFLDHISGKRDFKLYSFLDDNFDKISLFEWIDFFQKLYFDLMLIKFNNSIRYFIKIEDTISDISKKIEKHNIIEMILYLNNKKLLIDNNHNINARLLVNVLLQKIMTQVN
ncbi:DNA polymerase III subunit delta' [Candidatus Kinetoplastidibacterium galati]|uniref:DNA polymerase III subunit delta n=1 Tax=Candidatus Kinetoplastidibacterium galati TCC219 TaxID=1208921 RepID=M1LU14_9PROT|nr:DNA polymerase III subunit delta' [Candidatus Kinetoplastibacterium galatii]AGF49047.1 DNA polymerase III subunit delta' [Candidatus Kinetoplastibacterium galatii TCC219]